MTHELYIEQGELFPEGNEYHLQTAKTHQANRIALEKKEVKPKAGRRSNDYLGKRFGKLLVIGMVDDEDTKEQVWSCKCDCGQTIMATASNLRSLRHCGCMGFGRGKKRFLPGGLGWKGSYSRSRPAARRASPNKRTAINGLFSQYRHNAKIRGFEWHLSMEQFEILTSRDCHYCGSSPNQTAVFRRHKYTYNGVDRIDSLLGYTESNCVPCCGFCNRAKSDYSYQQFIDWLDRLKTNQDEKKANP